MAYNAHSGKHSKEIKPQFTCDVFPTGLHVLDMIGQLGTPMDTDKDFKIRRIDPFWPTGAHIDAPKAFARVGIGYVAANLFDADLQDLRHLLKGQQRLALIC